MITKTRGVLRSILHQIEKKNCIAGVESFEIFQRVALLLNKPITRENLL
jgi:hypothetical protein